MTQIPCTLFVSTHQHLHQPIWCSLNSCEVLRILIYTSCRIWERKEQTMCKLKKNGPNFHWQIRNLVKGVPEMYKNLSQWTKAKKLYWLPCQSWVMWANVGFGVFNLVFRNLQYFWFANVLLCISRLWHFYFKTSSFLWGPLVAIWKHISC